MKKAWFILVCSSILFLGLKFLLPKKTIDLYFLSNQNQFKDLLDEQIQDAKAQKRINDSIELAEKKRVALLAEQEKRKHDSIEKLIKYKQMNRNGLQHFFNKLNNLEKNKNKQVRIAFFGDSMEDADMIIMQFRNYLQRRFGGEGVGYVPMTSVTADGRYSILHRFSKNWQEDNFMKKGYGKFDFGLNGKAFYIGKDSIENEVSVTFKCGTSYKNLPLINPVLFYGRAKESLDSLYITTLSIKKDKDSVKTIEIKAKRFLNTYKLPNYPKKITLTIKDKQRIPFYGVSFASKNGIIVDNLAMRGNSGLPLSKLKPTLMQQFNRYLNYDLVILAYGTNVFSFENTKYQWYKSSMLRNIKHIQKCFPNADILISSMGDRSVKIDGVMQTPEHLPKFIDLQYAIAKESNSGFYNLYKEMGGENSMVKWVEKEHLANKDYTHFSPKGAEKAGKMLYNWLMTSYEDHVKHINKGILKNHKSKKEKTK